MWSLFWESTQVQPPPSRSSSVSLYHSLLEHCSHTSCTCVQLGLWYLCPYWTCTEFLWSLFPHQSGMTTMCHLNCHMMLTEGHVNMCKYTYMWYANNTIICKEFKYLRFGNTQKIQKSIGHRSWGVIVLLSTVNCSVKGSDILGLNFIIWCPIPQPFWHEGCS